MCNLHNEIAPEVSSEEKYFKNTFFLLQFPCMLFRHSTMWPILKEHFWYESLTGYASFLSNYRGHVIIGNQTTEVM